VLLAGGIAAASPSQGKPVRKPAPPDMESDRLSRFVDAIIADKRGDLDDAVNRYQSANSGKDYPAVHYNLADLHRRRERWDEAIRSYEKYLELAPSAPDRAAVQKIIEQIKKTPQQIVVDGEDLDAVVFVDGKPAGPSPLVTTLPEGDHVIDRIGPESYQHDYVNAKPMKDQHVTAYRDGTGNVVLATSTSYGGSWQDGEVTYKMNQRFTLKPGRYDTYFFSPGRACSPVSFQVPADGVVFVFIDAPRKLVRDGCTPIKVTAQKIQFPKGAPLPPAEKQ
jgi:tetratricopeptide (TPR) repeat protein